MLLKELLTEVSWARTPLPEASPVATLPETSRLKLAIVLPCHNAAGALPEVLEALSAAQQLHDIKIKLYAFDDGSLDPTLEHLTFWAFDAPHPVAIYHHPLPNGPMRTTLEGYKTVLADRLFTPDYIVRLDADMDDDPAEILKGVVQGAALMPDGIALERSRSWHDASPLDWQAIMIATRKHTTAVTGTIPFDPFTAATALSRPLLEAGLALPIISEYNYPWGFEALLLLQAWREGAMVQRLILENSCHTPDRTTDQLLAQADAHAWVLSYLWGDV